MKVVGPMKETERGGTAVVLLHGWGAPGDDLVPLAAELAGPRIRFIVPAAPLPHAGGGRAWWHLEQSRPPYYQGGALPLTAVVPPDIASARTAIQVLLREIRERYQPDRVAIAGFSQGGMLALDVALAGDPAVDGVAVLSGSLLLASTPGLAAAQTPRPPVFLSHGRSDVVLPFALAGHTKGALEGAGFRVAWHPFSDGHTIPAEVLTPLRQFLENL